MRWIRASLIGLPLVIVSGLLFTTDSEAKSYYLWEIEQILRFERKLFDGEVLLIC